MSHRTLSILLLITAVTAGCESTGTQADEPLDDLFSSFSGALEEHYGLTEGDAVTAGVLHVVNTATLVELDIDARLNATSAHNIIAHRQGPDGSDHTADDELFDDLSELDAVHYVGPTALERLVEYAWDQGAVAAAFEAEGSPLTPSPGHVQALASELMLQVVNTRTEQQLDDEVGLNKLAAHSIASYRHGADGVPGSDDDESIDDLDELDAIKYVGDHALNTLRNHVFESGLVEAALEAQAHAAAAATAAAAALPGQALLELVNRASLEELDLAAGIDSRAAEGIVAFRPGPDGILGNDDDRWFGSIEEVDAIAWVGVSTLQKLETYALEAGYLPPDWTHGWQGDRFRMRMGLPLAVQRSWGAPYHSIYQRTLLVCDVHIRTGLVLCRHSTILEDWKNKSCAHFPQPTTEEFLAYEAGDAHRVAPWPWQYFYPSQANCYSCWNPQSPDCTEPCTPWLSGVIEPDGAVTLQYETSGMFSNRFESVSLRFAPHGIVLLEDHRFEYEYLQELPGGAAHDHATWWICGENTVFPHDVIAF